MDVPAITVRELKEKIDKGEPFVLVDVREPNEIAISKLPGSVKIPLGNLPMSVNRLSTADDIVVHCRTGIRSARAVQFLMSVGFRKVWNLTVESTAGPWKSIPACRDIDENPQKMRVTVREAAALLDAPEEKVYAWIESGDLPACRINDQYRVNRSELLEWATSRKLSVDPALFHEEDEDERIPSVAESLAREGSFTTSRENYPGRSPSLDHRPAEARRRRRPGSAARPSPRAGCRGGRAGRRRNRDSARPETRSPFRPKSQSLALIFLRQPVDFTGAGRQARLRFLLPRQPDDPRSPPDAREDRFSAQRPGIPRGDSRARIGWPSDRLARTLEITKA